MYIPVIRNNRNNWLDTAFNDLFDMDWAPRHATTAPAVNVKESDKAFTMEVAAPGLKKEYCTVNINNEGNLVVKIEHKAEHEDKPCKEESEKFHYVRREFSYTKFQQTMLLPEDTDREAINAKVENGVLADVAPSILHIMGLEQPKEMTGKCLIKD